MVMSIFLAKSLMADAQARLLTYRNKYTFDGVKYAPLMYKIIMGLLQLTPSPPLSMLHVWVGLKVMPIDLIVRKYAYLNAMFWYFLHTTSETTRGDRNTQHNHTPNITTMVVELLAP
jgi:hypothetical protein